MTQLTSPAATSAFDLSTTLIPVEGSAGSFRVELDPAWSSLVGVHGGYLCAIGLVGAKTVVPGRSVRTLSTSFLRSGRVGEAQLSVRELRRGRTTSTVVTELVQGGKVLTSSHLTLMEERTGVEWSEPMAVDLPPVDDCVGFTPPGDLAHFRQFDLRFDPQRLPFDLDRARVCGYVRPTEARPADAAWLATAVDGFPPPAFARVAPPTGGMSIDLTTHIHQDETLLGPDEWLVGEFEIRESSGGLAVEHGRIGRTDGTVLAESFHTRFTAT